MDHRLLTLVLLGSFIANVQSQVSFEISKDTTSRSFTDITLNCSAKGTVSGNISWTHFSNDTITRLTRLTEGSSLVSSAPSSKYGINASKSSDTWVSDLTIKNLTFSDRGMYMCSIGEPTNDNASKALELQVVFPLTKVTFNLINSKRQTYNNATAPDYKIAPGTHNFSCYAHGSYPAAVMSLNTTSRHITIIENSTRNLYEAIGMATPMYTSYVEGRFSVGVSETAHSLVCSAASLGEVYPTLNAILRLNIVMPNITCEPVRPEHKVGEANVTLSCRIWSDMEVNCHDVSWSVKRQALEELVRANTDIQHSALGRLASKCMETNRTSVHTTLELGQLNEASFAWNYSVLYAGEMFSMQNPMWFRKRTVEISTAVPPKSNAFLGYNNVILVFVGSLSAFLICDLRF
ncbi:hypothetical protein DPMN_093215 [Dreissena polymorpha]|uniref:Ig-like domain-containing protein n=1 Tax=Dreissena polymorpha TaxID=45954 RepID=A0A9D4R1N1_DREPO|nr:hypothetical protein DPMN_093215 [Dreissena polymorpha]